MLRRGTVPRRRRRNRPDLPERSQGSGCQPGPEMAGVALGQSSTRGAKPGEALECHGVLTTQAWGVSSQIWGSSGCFYMSSER